MKKKKAAPLTLAPAPKPSTSSSPAQTMPANSNVKEVTLAVGLTRREMSLLMGSVREYREGILPIVSRNTNLRDMDAVVADCLNLQNKLRYYIEQAARMEGPTPAPVVKEV